MPRLEELFNEPKELVEEQLLEDVFPRFVQHQISLSAERALSKNLDSKYRGLGDSFALTDPSYVLFPIDDNNFANNFNRKPDNPIVCASDGFIDITGYSRREIYRNCRFLQGPRTDRCAVHRIKTSIDISSETVELLLNYRKNGDPFWNLLYVGKSNACSSRYID